MQKPQYQDIEECIIFLSGENFWQYTTESPSVQSLDKGITTSLGKQIMNGLSFTEKQSHIGIRLVKKYSSLLKKYGFNTEEILAGPVFRNPFRTIDKTKSVYIDGESLVLKSPFIPDLVNTVKKRKGHFHFKGTYQPNSKEWNFDYNEQNVLFLLDAVKGKGFSIDKKVQDDYNKIKSIIKKAHQNAFDYYPNLNVIDNKFKFNNIIIDETDPRKAIWSAKRKGCMLYHPNVEKLINQKNHFDKILLGDYRVWHVNNSTYARVEFEKLIQSANKVIIMVPSFDSNILKDWLNYGFYNTNKNDIAVSFRFKKDKEANDLIKTMNVNKFDPEKKIFIISEKLPKPVVQSVDPDLIIVDMPTMPSHYKTQQFLENKPAVVYYSSTKPSGDFKVGVV